MDDWKTGWHHKSGIWDRLSKTQFVKHNSSFNIICTNNSCDAWIGRSFLPSFNSSDRQQTWCEIKWTKSGQHSKDSWPENYWSYSLTENIKNCPVILGFQTEQTDCWSILYCWNHFIMYMTNNQIILEGLFRKTSIKRRWASIYQNLCVNSRMCSRLLWVYWFTFAGI